MAFGLPTDVQRVIAKYGLAAHLALVAVAPLFLYPFCPERSVAFAVLWLALFGAVWAFLEPSLRPGEMLHDARARVASSVARDPVFWLSLVLVAYTGIRAFNDGIRMAYDAEKGVWKLAETLFPLYPGCVDGAGLLPFAATVALAVLLVAARHSLGRSARMAFFLVASAVAGLAAVVMLLAARQGQADCLRALKATGATASFAGVAFGFYFLAGILSLTTAFERSWNRVMLLFPLSIGGTALGAFAFAPPFVALAMGGAGVILLVLSFVFALKKLRRHADFKLLVVFALSLTVGGLLTVFLMPRAALDAHAEAFVQQDFFGGDIFALRQTLSELALRAWKTAPWIGTGLGTFGLDIRFQALPADWATIPRGQQTIPNGGWLLLTERGIVGCALFALPFGFLLFAYLRRLVLWVRGLSLPHPASFLAPLVFALLVADVLIDGSFLRADVLLVICAELAISAKSFPKQNIHSNG